MEPIAVFPATTDLEFDEARQLFSEYAAGLGVDLCFQNFEHELENIKNTYGAPNGCLLLAHCSERPIGCVAFRPFMEGICEMKRLYVRPEARGLNVGRRLAIEIIQRARSAGYRSMVLDTLTSLTAAQTLYRSLGFRQVEPYYANPLQGVVYMELDLLEKTT